MDCYETFVMVTDLFWGEFVFFFNALLLVLLR